MKLILQAIMAFFTKNPQKLTALSKAAGKPLNTPSAAVAWAKGNRVNTAIAAVNMGAAGTFIADFLLEEEVVIPAVENILKNVARPGIVVVDELQPNAEIAISDLPKYADELRMIGSAARRLGGYDRLQELRAVLAMPDQYFELEAAVRSFNS